MYYDINENSARAAQGMNSFSDYSAGSATAEYRGMVDKAAALAEKCKQGKSAEDAAKIDSLLDRYARRLADNINADNRNRAACPSILICGPSNFPMRKKERQNARADHLRAEYQEIDGLLDKMRSIGNGGIQSDDPEALDKLRAKLADLQQAQQAMRDANAEARRVGHPVKVPDAVAHTVQHLALSTVSPFAPWALSNNNANMHRISDRIAQLERAKTDAPAVMPTAAGVEYREDSELMRAQIVFDGKPSEAVRDLLKANGFRWAPSQGAWQRQLTDNGRSAAKRVMLKLAEVTPAI